MSLSRVLIAAALALLMLAPAAGAAGEPISWRLGRDFVLYQDGTTAVTSSTPVLIPEGEGRVWSANAAALVDLTFPTGETFEAALQILEATSLQVTVGTTDPTGAFTACVPPVLQDLGLVLQPSTSGLPAGVSGSNAEMQRAQLVHFTFDANDCSVTQGDRLALFIEAIGGDAKVGTTPINKMTGLVPPSTFTYTASPPAYPTPELPTLALAGIGVALVAVFRRHA